MDKEPYRAQERKMAFKNDPGMLLVNAWLPRSDADELVRLANSQGISRSELLRRVARELLTEEYDTHNGENER
jgi:hypothetical protein